MIIKFLCLINMSLSYFYILYIFQLKGYFKFRLLKSYHKSTDFLFNILTIIICSFLFIFNISLLNKIIIIIINLIYLIKYSIKLTKKKKIAFKITFRIKRNILIYSILLILFVILTIFFKQLNIIIYFYLIYLPHYLICFCDIIDLYKYIELFFFYKKAKKYIKNNPQIIKIGITGSNGKTSIKNILYQFLLEKFNVVQSPKNFNTPKGVLYTINNNCTENTDIIIFEMGARCKNDIKTLCKISCPNLGIVSSIAPQHLETFKSLNNIYTTKKELPDYLKNNLCIYNFNSPLARKMWEEKSGKKALICFYNIYSKIKNNKNIKILKNIKFNFSSKKYKIDIYAKGYKIIDNKMQFSIFYQSKQYKIQTSLLGSHSIINILTACLMSINLGLDITYIIQKFSLLRPSPHRLELIKSNVTILDDSYNCSLLSAKMACEVLSKFNGKKMICTPGIIEGGKSQNLLNKNLCNIIKSVADYIVIVGKTNAPTFKHCLNGCNNVYFAENLEDAKKYFKLINSQDCLLLLNDLPDDYN